MKTQKDGKMKRRPSPWRVQSGAVWASDNTPIMQITDASGYEDAVFIVRACNAHEELVEALREIAKGMGTYSHDPLEHATNTIGEMKTLARNALTKATKDE